MPKTMKISLPKEMRLHTHLGLHQSPEGDEPDRGGALSQGDCNLVKPFYQNQEGCRGSVVFLAAPGLGTSTHDC